MEEKLVKFIDEYSDVLFRLAGGTLSFIKSQVLKYAEDLLEASKNQLVDSSYFLQLSTGIEKLLEKLYEDSEIGYASERKDMTRMIKNFLAIISQSARLLECMEINPEKYFLSDPEALKFSLQSPSHMPFILSHLNLTIQAVEDKHPHVSNVRNVTLNDFDRVKLISQGAYSSVHLARLRQTGERFALKRVNKQRMLMKKQVDQVFHERDILSYTENPFVVGFLCTFQTKNHLYYVMEFVEGGDLASLLKNVGSLPVEMARLYFAESVLALEYIHSLGIIHRDLKPDNFLITSEGHIKLTDFGLSKVGLASATATMVDDHMNRDRQFKDAKVLGTPDYIAPEVILGQPYGFAVDWWSMGIILYEMLLGITPFCSTTVEDLFGEITNENLKIEWPEEGDEDEMPPKEAQHLVESLLTQNPEERLGSHALGGVTIVKAHEFFEELNWNSLLRRKAEIFVPELQGDEDTSYFDARSERYKHTHSSDEDSDGETNSHNNPFIKFDSSSRRMSILLSDWSLNSSCDIEEGKRKASSASTMTLGSEEGSTVKNEDQGSDIDELVTAIDDVICDDALVPQRPSVPKRTLSVQSTVETQGQGQGDVVIRHGRSNSETPPMKANPREKERSDRNRRSRSIDQVVTEDTLKHSSSSSSNSSYTPLSPRNSVHLTAPYSIQRRDNRFGFNFKPIRVYFGETDNYWLHHVIDHVDKGGPAEEAGLKPDMVITYVNGEKVTGLTQPQVWQLMLSGKNSLLLHATPIEDTSIRKGGKKRTATLGRRIARRFNFFRSSKSSSNSGTKLKSRSKTIFRRKSSKAKERDWIPPRAPSPEAGIQPSREPKRTESYKDKLSKLKPHTPMRRNTTPASPSPLTRTPSPTSLHLTISKDRSNSTSPLTHMGSPTSSPTGSSQFLETPPDSPPKNARKPERSSSLFVKSTQHDSLLNRPERHSVYEQSSPFTSAHLARRTSGSDLTSGGKATLSPLLKQTRSPETKKKNKIEQRPPSPTWNPTWDQRKDWFEKR
jgi:microtubule-associated serine/threonine kinase